MTAYIMAALLALCGLIVLLLANGLRDRLFALGAFAVAIAAIIGGWFFSDARIIASDLKESYGPEMICRRCLESHPIGRIESEKMEESEYTGFNWIARVYPKPTDGCKGDEPTVIKLEYEWPCVITSEIFDAEESRHPHHFEMYPSGVSAADSNKYAKIARGYKEFTERNEAALDEKWASAEAELLPLISGPDLPDTNAVSKIVCTLRDAEHKNMTIGCEEMRNTTNCPAWFIRQEFLVNGDISMRIMMERIRQLKNLEYAISPRMDADRAKVHYARYRAGAAYIKAVKNGDDEATAKKKAKTFLDSLQESK